MNQESPHLSNIMEKHNRIANLQVVFVDVEKYSRRRTLTQISVIDALTSCMDDALKTISKKYIDYSQANNVNFNTDIVILPTGDGAAAAFSFDGLHDIHLSFALSLLKSADRLRSKETCPKFQEEGWCNCHQYFNLRVGISEGKGVLFKDIRHGFNVAGGVVNMAARAMNLAERNQIMFTDEGYSQIIDMVDDPYLVDRFVEFTDVEVKHNLKMNVYQYADPSCAHINSNPPELLTLKKKVDAAFVKMRDLGFPTPRTDMPRAGLGAMVESLERMAEAFTLISAPPQRAIPIKAELEEERDDETTNE